MVSRNEMHRRDIHRAITRDRIHELNPNTRHHQVEGARNATTTKPREAATGGNTTRAATGPQVGKTAGSTTLTNAITQHGRVHGAITRVGATGSFLPVVFTGTPSG